MPELTDEWTEKYQAILERAQLVKLKFNVNLEQALLIVLVGEQ